MMGNSMLKTIKSRGLSKCKKVSVCNFPGATSKGILNEIGNPPWYPDRSCRSKWPYKEHQYAEKCQKIMQKSKKNLARYKGCVFE